MSEEDNSDARNSDGVWSLAVHGGAGTIRREKMTDEREAAYRSALNDALDAGRAVLCEGGTSLDAVEASVVSLEDEPLFNAGRGAVYTSEGQIELDASIMDGRTRDCGAVVGVTRTRNPVRLARRVMHDSPHVMLQGAGADQFARVTGVEQVDASWFYTEHRWAQLERARKDNRISLDHDDGKSSAPSLGTVGAVARDVYGNLAAATSTGGMTNKMWGRVGDSPIIGAGTYAHNASCAVSATGHGEYFIRATLARDIAALMEYAGQDLIVAAKRKIMDELTAMGGTGGIIGVDGAGRCVLIFNTPGMYRGQVSASAPAEVAIFSD